MKENREIKIEEKTLIYPADNNGYPTSEANNGIQVNLDKYSGIYSTVPLDLSKLVNHYAKLNEEEKIWEYIQHGFSSIDNLELAKSRVRNKRDSLLSSTDKYMVVDFPIAENNLAAIKEYRQALRDITKQPTFDEKGEVEWPVKPELK